jgi:hypothetical protein
MIWVAVAALRNGEFQRNRGPINLENPILFWPAALMLLVGGFVMTVIAIVGAISMVGRLISN